MWHTHGMRYFRTIGYVLFIASVAGCTGSYAEMAARSPEAIKQLPNDQVVAVYASQRAWGESKKYRAEIERRGLFTQEQWSKIDRKKVAIGDPESLVWAAWGNPDDVSTLTTTNGSSRVLYYGDHAENRVYIENGVVTAIGQ